MPIYEYRCDGCGKEFEVLVGLSSSDDAIECPQCGGEHIHKLMSASYSPAKIPQRQPGKTCCGADERCDSPPCSDDGPCCKS